MGECHAVIADDLITGLRLGGVALFVWLGWRVLFESLNATEQPKHAREKAWWFQRYSILTMCFVMVFLASPANLLFANGYISLQTNFLMMCGVTVGAMVYATLLHHALDVLQGSRPATWMACALIAALSLFYGFLRAAP